MEYKRKEMFRMTFSSPLDAKLRVIEINGLQEIHPDETIYLHDLSLRGAKIECAQQYPDHPQKVRVLIQFQLNEKPLSVLGDIVWRKPSGKLNQYGIQFDIDVQLEKDLLWELKLYAKRNLQRKNSHIS